MKKPADFALSSHMERLQSELSHVIRSGGSIEEIDRLIDAMSDAHRASLAAGGLESAPSKATAPVAVTVGEPESSHAL